MKKNKIYIVIILALVVGLFAGWLLFKGNTSPSAEHTQHNQSAAEPTVWTCSMHPQVRKDEPGACPICGMDLIPASKAENSSNEFGFQMTEAAVSLANIQTTVIGDVLSTNDAGLKLTGKIQANETQSASLVTHISGRIEKLYVSYTGEQVSKGQKIATVYSPELITAQKELLEAKKIEDISPGLLTAAKNKLRYLKISNQVVNNILSTANIRETFTIYAEHAGIVSNRRVSVGDYLNTGEVLFDVQNLNSLWAVFDVYENDLPNIKLGRKIDFTTPSFPNTKFSAVINFINPVINPQTRIATIRGSVQNSGNKLKPEMFTTGFLSNVNKSGNLTVPKTAVLWTGKRSVVYIKVPNTTIPTFEYREIEIGEPVGNAYAVVKGLEYGDEVVTNGAFVIDASAQLNNQASMMNKKVMAKNAMHAQHLPDFTSTTPNGFKTQLYNLTTAYIALKNALVESDSKKATIEAKATIEKLDKVDMSLVKGEAHIFWMEQLKAIQSHAKNINEEKDIEAQRKQFDFLSQALIKSLKVFGIAQDTFYVQNCPMANNNEGASWLSKKTKISNPYFGGKMMTCGSTQDTIDKSFKNPPMQQQSNRTQNLHNH